MLETGRALVDEAGVLLATVVGTRPGPRGERGIVLDAGVNLLYTANWYRHRLVTTRRGVPGRLVPTTVYGPLCMNIDVVRREMLLPPLDAGDRVAISPVGAYNTTQWMQFCQLRPAVVMVGEDQKVAVIRSGEDVEYLKALEHVPEWLDGDQSEGQT